MRRSDPNMPENPQFVDIMDYLKAAGKSFIVMEEPSGPLFDLKYMRSRHSDAAIPYEFIASAIGEQLRLTAQRAIDDFRSRVEILFTGADISGGFAGHITKLKEAYHLLSCGVMDIILKQSLLKQMGVKALFGGMGSHYSAGYNNPFAVVEVYHSFSGAMQPILTNPPRALEYYKAAFNIGRFLVLVPSPDERMPEIESICPVQNRYHYGAPEIRAYRRDDEALDNPRRKYGLRTQKSLLFVTSRWIDYSAFDKLLKELYSRLPQVKILLRPHPVYENSDAHKEHADIVDFMNEESLYNLLSVVDVVVSAPSAVIIEAGMFTDNVIAFPDKLYSAQDGS